MPCFLSMVSGFRVIPVFPYLFQLKSCAATDRHVHGDMHTGTRIESAEALIVLSRLEPLGILDEIPEAGV